MYQTNFDFICERARALASPMRVVIAGADSENILLGAFQCVDEGFAKLILLGDEQKITKMMKDLSLYARENYKIVNIEDSRDVVQAAIDMINAGDADVLMRGNVQTRDFLMPILDHKNDLVEKGRLLSQIALVKVPEYRRILALADVSVVVDPNRMQRKKIVQNVVSTLKTLGYEKPNVALMTLIEKQAFHMRDTVEAAEIVREHTERPIADCNLVGPIAYDLIISKEAARLKNFDCDLCGEFDAIICPNLVTGNTLIKAMRIHGHSSSLGVVVGAKIPIAIVSRSEPREQSYLSLAACAALQVQKVTWNV